MLTGLSYRAKISRKKEEGDITMARITYTVYKSSILATVISFLSSIFGMFGIVMAVLGLFDGEFEMVLAGLLFFAVFGLGGTMLAKAIGTRKANKKWWKETIRKQGWEAQLPHSVDVCFKVYNANPNQWTLNQIQKWNPGAAAQIRQALAQQTAKK